MALRLSAACGASALVCTCCFNKHRPASYHPRPLLPSYHPCLLGCFNKRRLGLGLGLGTSAASTSAGPRSPTLQPTPNPDPHPQPQTPTRASTSTQPQSAPQSQPQPRPHHSHPHPAQGARALGTHGRALDTRQQAAEEPEAGRVILMRKRNGTPQFISLPVFIVPPKPNVSRQRATFWFWTK